MNQRTDIIISTYGDGIAENIPGKTASRLGAAGSAAAVILVPWQYSYMEILIGTHGVIPHVVLDVVPQVVNGREGKGEETGDDFT